MVRMWSIVRAMAISMPTTAFRVGGMVIRMWWRRSLGAVALANLLDRTPEQPWRDAGAFVAGYERTRAITIRLGDVTAQLRAGPGAIDALGESGSVWS